MAWGQGTYPEGVYNKTIPGTYINIKVSRSPNTNVSGRGYLACPIELPWGTDDDIITVTADDYATNCFSIFGYTLGSPELAFIDEMFKNAKTLYLYRLNGGGHKAAGATGTAKNTGAFGNKISVVVEPNADDESFYNVITYLDGVEVDYQTVGKAGIDTITLNKGSEKSGTAVETADASFTFSDNQITVQFSNVPEGYKPSVRIKGQVGILAFTPGRMEDTELQSGNKHIVSYYSGAATNGEMTIEAVLTKDKPTVLKSCTYTCQVNEDAVVGADATEVRDNAFVEFNKTGLLEVTGGDTFRSGRDGTVSGNSHQKARDAFENVFFNVLAVPTTDREIQEAYIEYVRRQRDEYGVKFQIVVPAIMRPTPLNYEGVIEYVNEVTDPINDAQSDLCYWLAGAEAGCEVQNSCTAKVYDGRFNISAKVTRADQTKALNNGQILFHRDGDDVVILRDVNTFTKVEKEDEGKKSTDFSNNQVIRVLDGISTESANLFNRYYLGKRGNTDIQRAGLKADLVAIRTAYATIGAIEPYDETLLEIRPGAKPNEVIGKDGIRPIQAMDTLYLTIEYLGYE